MDFQDQEQQITFDLPPERLAEGMLSAKDQVGLGEVQVSAYDTAVALARSASTSDIIYQVTGTPQGFDIDVQAPPGLLPQAQVGQREIRSAVEQSIADPSIHGYFIYDGRSGGIRPDYQSVADDNHDIFRTVALAFLEKFGDKEPQELINQILAFLQAIPFDDLLDRPFPMSPPIPMLIEQRGDCEGKQVFLAGVLGVLFSDRPIYLINLPDNEHIVAGIAFETDLVETIQHEGRKIVLMDATGPAAYPFGNIPPQFKNSNRWVWNEFRH